LAFIGVWKTSTVLNLALKVIAVTHGGITICLGAVAKTKWLTARFGRWTIVQSLSTLDLCARLGSRRNRTGSHLLDKTADFASDGLLDRLQLTLGSSTDHLLLDDFGAAEFDAFNVGGRSLVALGLAVTWNSRALLADTVRELASTWFALALESSRLPLVWGILRRILALQSTVIWMVGGSTHVAFALTCTVSSTPVVAGKIILGDVHATEATSDSKATDVGVGRATTFAIGVLHWSVREGTLQVAADFVIAVRHEALVCATLTFTVGLASISRRLRFGASSDTETEELAGALGPVHGA